MGKRGETKKLGTKKERKKGEQKKRTKYQFITVNVEV